MHQSGPTHTTRWRLGFWSLIATQFQGAFNDNGLKFFVIYLILGQNPSEAEKDVAKAYYNHANSYLVKPVGFDEFKKLMDDLGFYWLSWNTHPDIKE